MTRTDAKLEALKAALITSPEYAEIVPFFVSVQEYLAGREAATGITAELSAGPSERNNAGFPLLSPSELKVDRDQATRFLLGLIDVLKLHGRDADGQLEKMATALANNRLDPGPLFLAILERRRPPLEEAAAAIEVPAALVEFVCEIPLRTMLEHLAEQYSMADVEGWHEGLCPICGSRAGMAELAGDEGRRYLSCSACSFKWPFKRMKCPYCGCEEAEKLSYFTVDDGPARVDVCKGCSRYIKTRDSRKGDAEVPMEVSDALTIHLDLVATREGYERGK